MARQRILEIEQAEVTAIGQDHQIVGMIIAQHQDGIVLDDGQNVAPGLSPGAKILVLIDLQPQRRHIPFGQQGDLAAHRRVVIRRQVRRRRLRRDPGEDVDGDLVNLDFAVRLAQQQWTDPVVAEILEQQQPLAAVDRQRARRREAAVEEVTGDGQERADILVRRRRIHQHRGLAGGGMDAEIAAETRIAGQRTDLGIVPAMRG